MGGESKQQKSKKEENEQKQQKALKEATKDTKPKVKKANRDLLPVPVGDKSLALTEEQKKHNRQVKADIKSLNQSQAGAITPASLDAVDRLRDEDLKGASQGIQKNKEVIVHEVKQQALKQPAMFDR